MPIKIQPGMKFGEWEVIERDYNPTSKQHSTFWFCKCNLCGNIYSVSRDSLVNNKSQCCNHCKGTKISEKSSVTSWRKGDQYGFLTIIDRSHYQGKHLYVKCKCICGKEISVRLEHLKGQGHGRIISCGCQTKSSGEVKITQLLENNNINFQSQYRIKEFNILSPFDFAIFDDNNNLLGLIEFDGEQHFKPVKYFGGEEVYKMQKQRDKAKDDWCLKNNINLIRIPYTDYNKLSIEYLVSIFPELNTVI